MEVTKIRANDIKMVSVESIVPNPKNNNRHSIEQLQRLAKIIEYSGFREPLVVSNLSGFLICGHGRLEAARLVGMKEVPVIFQDFESEAMEYQHMTADNEIARWAEFDWQALHEDIKEYETDLDLDMLGIENFKILDTLEPQSEDNFSDKNKEIDVDDFGSDLEHTCPKCGFEFND